MNNQVHKYLFFSQPMDNTSNELPFTASSNLKLKKLPLLDIELLILMHTLYQKYPSTIRKHNNSDVITH